MIHMSDNYYIDADSNQYILQTRTTSAKGKEVIKNIGFYNTLFMAFDAYLQIRQRQCISQGEFELKDAIKALTEERRKVAEFLRGLESVEDEE